MRASAYQLEESRRGYQVSWGDLPAPLLAVLVAGDGGLVVAGSALLVVALSVLAIGGTAGGLGRGCPLLGVVWWVRRWMSVDY